MAKGVPFLESFLYNNNLLSYCNSKWEWKHTDHEWNNSAQTKSECLCAVPRDPWSLPAGVGAPRGRTWHGLGVYRWVCECRTCT